MRQVLNRLRRHKIGLVQRYHEIDFTTHLPVPMGAFLKVLRKNKNKMKENNNKKTKPNKNKKPKQTNVLQHKVQEGMVKPS